MFEVIIVVLLVIIVYNTKNEFKKMNNKIHQIETSIEKSNHVEQIKPLDLNDVTIVNSIIDLQVQSYGIESKLIGFKIPRLEDDIESIQDSGEQFYGYYDDGQLVGIISYQIEEDIVDIHRLAVYPNYFGKGIATALYTHINSIFKENKQIVATGKKNEPALAFYKKNGFEVIEEIQIEEGLMIVKLEKAIS